MAAPSTGEKTRGGTVKQGAYLVSDFKMASGEAMPLVVRRETRLPHTYALRYVIVACRTPGASSNSSRNVCQGIARGLSFVEDRGIDLTARLASGHFLTRDELADFANRCLERADGTGAVVTHCAKGLYADFVAYILWRFESVVHRAKKHDVRYLRAECALFVKRVRAQLPKATAGAKERDRRGLTEAQRALLLEVIKTDSPKNPFTPKLRRRNRAMILLRYGLRAGEMAGLYRTDY